MLNDRAAINREEWQLHPAQSILTPWKRLNRLENFLSTHVANRRSPDRDILVPGPIIGVLKQGRRATLPLPRRRAGHHFSASSGSGSSNGSRPPTDWANR